jgi:large subunit ribosomal protein L5
MTFAQNYKTNIIPKLKAKFGYTNDLAVPRLVKVTVNVGVGRLAKDKAYIDSVVEGITAITGQKPMLVAAKKSISAFKVRQGDIVGVTTVLRGQRMYDFVEKLVRITLPRVRDFRGLAETSVDGGGNLTIGFREQSAFAEIKMDQVEKTHGLEVTITTSAGNHQAGLELFKLLGFPFRKAS